MRLRFAAAMPEKGGRSCIVGAEVLRAPDVQGRRRWHFEVGYVERPRAQTIQGVAARVRDIVLPLTVDPDGNKVPPDQEPCVFIDAGTPQGFALRRAVRADWPERLHRPHRYDRTRFDQSMFAAFLEAYAEARITFLPHLEHRRELDRALILYRSGGTREAGDELASEDEAMVHALALATMFPSHGPEAALLVPPQTEPEPVVIRSSPPSQ